MQNLYENLNPLYTSHNHLENVSAIGNASAYVSVSNNDNNTIVTAMPILLFESQNPVIKSA